MFNDIDATNFSGTIPFYQSEFEEILSKVVVCYKMMVDDKVALVNDENKIRDVLVNDYLNKRTIKRKLELKYFINPEVPEINNKRPDIKFQSPNSFYTPEVYYTIECKRLDKESTTAKTGLNGKYIENGICRYTSKRYSSYHRVNGMIGFVVDKLDIDQNTNKINTLLSTTFPEANTITPLTKDNFIEDFDYHYHSIHTDIDGDDLKIHHLMLDVSKNIPPN